MRKKYIICDNCEQKFEDRFQFCPHCGQKSNENLTLKVLFYNTISNYFSVDARFFKSFIPLMVKPGYLAQRFIEGKRLLYLHPAQMYLFISVVFFFLFSFISRNQVEEIDKNLQKSNPVMTNSANYDNILDSLKINGIDQNIKDKSIAADLSSNDLKAGLSFDFSQKKVDSLIKINAPDKDIYRAMGMKDDAGAFSRKVYSQMLKFYKQRNGGSIYQAFLDTIPIAMFVLLPIFAFILKLLYFKTGSFSHHLVFSFYFFAFIFMVFSLMVLVGLVWKAPFWLTLLILLTTFFYLVLAVKRFYNQGYLVSLLKSGIASLTFLMIVMPLAASILFVFAFLFY
ncbi:hypothetical protein CJ739_3355 [Mariniflexile rhizosphaerae]|uniref:DUF3667 domain-containing protein n=1 Tax=unclassified Mariniflexile TaxID=2643887 RepID=UPI000CB20D09|nr:DUF3667 domain-containing protein [Mariniflexile sp. TRM1-10]AXP82417.1 hypothetical protein CJ739_3355 [Mariniflexile sp. TRM1-10]PLB18357.1 MAG: putative membrane protein [Flavobacteriaceae bacterium FS1-H7996/R]